MRASVWEYYELTFRDTRYNVPFKVNWSGIVVRIATILHIKNDYIYIKTFSLILSRIVRAVKRNHK